MKIKKFNQFQTYYSTSFPMSISNFIDLEVDERENYTLKEVQTWIKKYNISNDSKLLWVATKPYIAARYQMNSSDWSNAKEIYENNPEDFNVKEISSELGTLIKESDDGENGFLFLFN